MRILIFITIYFTIQLCSVSNVDRDNPRDPKSNKYGRGDISEKNKVKTPQFHPDEGQFYNNIGVTLSTRTEGVTIFYTLDGSAPDLNSEIYYEGIPIRGDDTTLTINAFASKEGMIDSDVGTGTYSVKFPYPNSPQFSRMAGTYNKDISFSMTPNFNEDDIYYTINGGWPDTNSTKYDFQPIYLSGDGNSFYIKAFSLSKKSKKSVVSKSHYKINYSYKKDEHMLDLSVSDYKQNIAGDWIGHRNCGSIYDKINVSFTFLNDTFTAAPLSTSYSYGAYEYWDFIIFTENGGTYEIYDLYANGKALGRMSSSWISEVDMMHISFYCNYSV